MRRHRKSVVLRYFHCPQCHSVMTATKSASILNGKDHRKMMYCWKCKEDRNFIMDDLTPIKRIG